MGLEQIHALNELVAKMPDLNKLLASINAAKEVLEKIARISKMLK